MVEKFLKAKHWQLFLLTFGIPMIFQMVLMGLMFSNIANAGEPSPEMFDNLFNAVSIISIVSILFMGVLFGWYWSVAVGLDKKIPENLRLNLKRFKLVFFFPLIYLIVITVFVGTMMNGIMNGMMNPENGLNLAFVGVFGIIFLLHICSICCIFYCLYFVAKTIKTAETQRRVGFGDFAGEFFLIWFFPIGIWFIQPKVNQMIEEQNHFL